MRRGASPAPADQAVHDHLPRLVGPGQRALDVGVRLVGDVEQGACDELTRVHRDDLVVDGLRVVGHVLQRLAHRALHDALQIPDQSWV